MRPSEYIKSERALYLERAGRLQGAVAKIGARNVAAFVLFTPRQTYERAVIEFRYWHRTGIVKGSFHNTRRRYIDALPDDSFFERRPNESALQWERRLGTIKGLGLAKAPFLCSLLAPLAPDTPVCLDVWILRLLKLAQPNGRPPESIKVFQLGQRRIRNRARRYGLPPFLYQWIVWDYIRSAGAPGQYLLNRDAVIVTDIAADLEP